MLKVSKTQASLLHLSQRCGTRLLDYPVPLLVHDLVTEKTEIGPNHLFRCHLPSLVDLC